MGVWPEIGLLMVMIFRAAELVLEDIYKDLKLEFTIFTPKILLTFLETYR